MMRVVGTLVAAMVALLGCGMSSPEAADRPVSAAPVTTFLVKETELAGVVVQAKIPLEPAGPKPAVIALHAGTRPLLAAGFVAVTYKAKAASPRPQATPAAGAQAVGKWVLASPAADLLGKGYLHEIAAAADTVVPAVLDWMVTLPEVDPSRLGMAGSSTNGFVTLQATAVDPRLRVAVAIAACGDYQRFLQFSSMGMEGRPLALSPDYARWLEQQEVINHPDRLLHAAVVMINRSGDPLSPVSCADETARVLEEAYARAGQPQRFRYLRIEREGHGVGREEADAANAWLQQWLAPDAGVSGKPPPSAPAGSGARDPDPRAP